VAVWNASVLRGQDGEGVEDKGIFSQKKQLEAEQKK
jgi:hypothetical protein